MESRLTAELSQHLEITTIYLYEDNKVVNLVFTTKDKINKTDLTRTLQLHLSPIRISKVAKVINTDLSIVTATINPNFK